MKTLESRFLEMDSHFHRVVSIYGLGVVVALGQTNAFSVDYVYGRYEFYHILSMSKKFCIILSPTFPLFSGWNCAV